MVQETAFQSPIIVSEHQSDISKNAEEESFANQIARAKSWVIARIQRIRDEMEHFRKCKEPIIELSFFEDADSWGMVLTRNNVEHGRFAVDEGKIKSKPYYFEPFLKADGAKILKEVYGVGRGLLISQWRLSLAFDFSEKYV